jgi:SpoVK/Ycf46/Vps4 family AAA+-type ATPase
VSSLVTAPKAVQYADLGGIEPVLDEIRELIEYPLKHPEVGEGYWWWCVSVCPRREGEGEGEGEGEVKVYTVACFG